MGSQPANSDLRPSTLKHSESPEALQLVEMPDQIRVSKMRTSEFVLKYLNFHLHAKNKTVRIIIFCLFVHSLFYYFKTFSMLCLLSITCTAVST